MQIDPKTMIGKRFGFWTVLRKSDPNLTEEYGVNTSGRNHNDFWIVQCECGTIRAVRGNSLRRGMSRGCKRCNMRRVNEKRMQEEVFHVDGRQSTTLCFDCQVYTCAWLSSGGRVLPDGVEAEPTDVQGNPTYRIKSCPMFKPYPRSRYKEEY